MTKNIKAIQAHEYKTKARRPQNSVMDTNKFYKTFVIDGKI